MLALHICCVQIAGNDYYGDACECNNFKCGKDKTGKICGGKLCVYVVCMYGACGVCVVYTYVLYICKCGVCLYLHIVCSSM